MPPLRPGLILYRPDPLDVTAIMLKERWRPFENLDPWEPVEWVCDVMMVFTERGRDFVHVNETYFDEPFLESLWEAPR